MAWSLIIVIVIVNSRFLRAPTKTKSWESVYSQALVKKSIGSELNSESQAGRQSDGYGGW